MSYFSNNKYDEDIRRDIAFQLLIAHRDLLQLAKKRKTPPTYENALGLLHELAPEYYEEITTLLTRKNESEIIRLFHQLAEVKSKESGKEITAIELLDKQIETYQTLVNQDSTQNLIRKKLVEHEIARAQMTPLRLTENRILNRDYSKIDRSDYAKKYFEDDHFVDYTLKNQDILRIRFLHPDSDEHISGADLIYEQYDLENEKVRFIFIQYKIWNKGVMYISQAKNLPDQMNRMKGLLCDKQYCCGDDGNNYSSDNYRLPYCSGFVRPTDKIQESDSKLMSSGYHIPLCKAIQIAGEFGQIDRERIAENSFNSRIFEELFKDNMIGSKWIPVSELTAFYEENKLFIPDNRVKLYVQEHISKKNKNTDKTS